MVGGAVVGGAVVGGTVVVGRGATVVVVVVDGGGAVVDGAGRVGWVVDGTGPAWTRRGPVPGGSWARRSVRAAAPTTTTSVDRTLIRVIDVFFMAPGLTGPRRRSFRCSSVTAREGIVARSRLTAGVAHGLLLRLPGWLVRLGWLLATAVPQPGSTGEVDDLVVARAKQGDQSAFADIVRHYDHRLRALAFRLLGDRDRMDDVLQEAYVKAYRSLPDFRGASGLGTWLYRITYNACVDDLRRRSTTAQPADDPERAALVVDARPGPDDVAVGRQDLAAALDGLPADQRAAVLLVDAYGLDYADAASVLGVRAGTIGSRLSRARAVLREALDAGGGSP